MPVIRDHSKPVKPKKRPKKAPARTAGRNPNRGPAPVRHAPPKPRHATAPRRTAPNQVGPAPTRDAIRRAYEPKRTAPRRDVETRSAAARRAQEVKRDRKRDRKRLQQPFAKGIAPTFRNVRRKAKIMEAPGMGMGAIGRVAPTSRGMKENLAEVRTARQNILSREQFDQVYLGTRNYDKYLHYVAGRRKVPLSMMVAIADPVSKAHVRRMIHRAERANLRGRLLLDNGVVFPFGADWIDVMRGRSTVVDGRTLEAWPGTPWAGGVGPHTAKNLGTSRENWQSMNAIDIMAPIGTPIYAVADGMISPSAGFGPSSEGNRLELDIRGDAVFYQHMSEIGPGIQPGVRVRRGQLIGYSGAGSNGAQHLHIALMNGDPEALFDYGAAAGI